jgi:hypothetical protein
MTNMKNSRKLWASAAVLAGITSSAPAFAQSVEEHFQIGLATPILAYSTGTIETEGPLNLETETDVSSTQWGLGHAVAGEFGYGLNDALVLGAFLQLGGESQTLEFENGAEAEADSFRFLLGPKIDYMFLEGKTVRPFVGGIIGLTVDSSEDDTDETSLTGFELQGRVGLRAFVTETFSIDPAFYMGWSTASGEVEPPGPAPSTDVSVSAFNVGLTVGVSGWVD